MTTRPFLNALIAAGYIGVIVTVLFNTEQFNAREFGIIAPITFLSTLVLSAALMGYLFFYQPVRLLIEGKQNEASKFLFSTIASFVGVTAAVIIAWFLLSTLL